MKKLLLASTALVMSAGFASAQVSLSGDARMGLVYDGNDVQMNSRARVTFTLSGETDTGLAFGGSFRADNAGGAAAGTAGSVFISGDFGRVTMGDTAGAARYLVGDLYGVGLTGLGDLNELGYIDRVFGSKPAARYDYTIDGFTFAVSTQQLGTYSTDGLTNAAAPGLGYNQAPAPGADGWRLTQRNNWSVAAAYSFEGFTVSAGYEQVNNRTSAQIDADGNVIVAANPDVFKARHYIVGAEYEMDGVKVKGIYGSFRPFSGGGSRNQYGLSVEGSFDATTVSAFARRGFDTTRAVGIGASYDLGGGASIVGGAVRAAGTTQADFGLSFSF